MDQKNIEGYASPESLADAIIEEVAGRQMVTSLHACLFARKVYTPEVVADCFECLGMGSGVEELVAAGRRIFDLKNRLRRKLGFDLSKLRIPFRVLDTPTPTGKVGEGFIRAVIDAYREKTGL